MISTATGFARLEELREELLDVCTTIDHIKLQVIPHIKSDYMLKIGCWEKLLMEARLDERLVKRRLALIQAQLNRGKVPDTRAIDDALHEELMRWKEEIDQVATRYVKALEMRTMERPMTAKEVAELKRLWRTMAKRFHPDLNPVSDDAGRAMFQMAMEAYRTGDIELLRSIEIATRELDHESETPSTPEAMAAEIEACEIELSAMRTALQELEASPEMVLGRNLDDPDWLTERISWHKHEIQKSNRNRDAYKERIDALLPREGE